MSKFVSVDRINALKSGIESKTGEAYADLTAGVQALVDGYGQGSGGLVPVNCITTVNTADAGYNNGIATGVSVNNIGKIEIRFKYDYETERCIWLSSFDGGTMQSREPYINMNEGVGFDSFSVIENVVDSDGITHFVANLTKSTTHLMRLGCWHDMGYSRSVTIYGMDIYSRTGDLLQSLSPAVKDNIAGMVDSISGTFFSNWKSWQPSGIVAGELV